MGAAVRLSDAPACGDSTVWVMIKKVIYKQLFKKIRRRVSTMAARTERAATAGSARDPDGPGLFATWADDHLMSDLVTVHPEPLPAKLPCDSGGKDCPRWC